jgi:hypothetical protein
MAVKMSEHTSARIPVPSQAAVMTALVSGLLENSKARKAIAATAYRHFGPGNRLPVGSSGLEFGHPAANIYRSGLPGPRDLSNRRES